MLPTLEILRHSTKSYP